MNKKINKNHQTSRTLRAVGHRKVVQQCYHNDRFQCIQEFVFFHKRFIFAGYLVFSRQKNRDEYYNTCINDLAKKEYIEAELRWPSFASSILLIVSESKWLSSIFLFYFYHNNILWFYMLNQSMHHIVITIL